MSRGKASGSRWRWVGNFINRQFHGGGGLALHVRCSLDLESSRRQVRGVVHKGVVRGHRSTTCGVRTATWRMTAY